MRDLDSRNGTLVNGTGVEEQWLQHGDEIATGDSSFLFLLEDEEAAPAAGRVEFEDGAVYSGDHHHPSQRRGLSAAGPDVARVAGDLALGPESERTAQDQPDRACHSRSQRTARPVLDLIFEVVPAGRGAILLADREGQQFNSMFGRMRQAGQPQLVKVSRTVARQVLEQGVAILGSDVPGSEELREVESLAASQVRSLLCVPLTVFQQVIGCIYLDSDSPATVSTKSICNW